MSDTLNDHSPAMDVLQGYFDDLLIPADPTENRDGAQLLPKTVRKVVSTAEPRPVITLEQPQLVAERLAKQKLAKLLTSAPVVSEKEVSLSARVDTDTSTKTTHKEQQQPNLKPEPEPEPELELELESSAVDALAWLENGRPAWAQERFDVLLFDVNGLTLAVPLIALGQIQSLTDELTPLFGQADWFMGMQPTPLGQVNTVNTAKFVMPERYDDSFLASAKYVISINGLSWGLAVSSVNQPTSLQPEDVKWRSDRTKRPWLAGTVKEKMCALLDIPMMGKILQDSDANQKKRQ